MRRGWSSDDEAADLEKIRIGFNCQDGDSTYFQVKESTKIQELVQAFCRKRKIEYKFAKFIFHDKKLPYRGTVGEAGLMDQDEIQVLIDQTSG